MAVLEVEVRKSGLELRKEDTEVGRELEIPADVGFLLPEL